MVSEDRLKGLVNGRADVVLRRLGHSDRMRDDAKRQAWWWFRARKRALAARAGLFQGWGVVWSRTGWAELVPIEVPGPAPGEVTIRVLSSVVSPGTERAQYLRLPNAAVKLPHRPGYSAAGRVVAVGSGVVDLSPGDLVAVHGAPHASVVTAESKDVFRVPHGVLAEDAALVALGVVAGQAVRLAAPEEGAPLCTIGAGLVGLLSQRLAAAGGAGPTVVVATSRSKEPKARAGGASDFLLHPGDAAAIAALQAPRVIEATGDPDAVRVAAAAAGRDGRIVLAGSSRGVTRSFPVSEMQAKSLRLIGAHAATMDMESSRGGPDVRRVLAEGFLEALAERRLAVGDLVDVRVDPREAAKLYRRLSRSDGMVAAHFDWSDLPASPKASAVALLRAPDVSGRGIGAETRAFGATPRRAATGSPKGVERASGHLGIGLIGCGDIAVHNAAAIAVAPNASIAACCDTNRALAEDIASSHGAAVTTRIDELLARRDVDAVFICVPHHLHAPLAIRAAEHGKHVIVEKPAANNLASALEMSAAAERAGITLSFCFPQRYQPSVVEARRLIASGAIGTLGGVFVKLLMDRSPAYWRGGFSGRSTSGWRDSVEQAGGGVLIMNLSHYFDLIRHLLGVEAETVIATTAAVDREGEVEDTASLSVQFDNGAVGTILGCSAVRGTLAGEFRIWGTDGHVAIEPDPRVFTLTAVDGVRTSRWQSLKPLPEVSTRAAFVSRFASAVHDSRAPDVTAADGIAVQALIEAAYRSSRAGCVVRPRELLGAGAP